MMSMKLPTITINNCIVTTIPSVHNNMLFADCVHRVFEDPFERPEVIAVELDEFNLNAIKSLFNTLDIYNGKPFPIMMGILNEKWDRKTIPCSEHPPWARNGLDVDFEIPAFLRNLNTTYELIPLNPSDSIIEAIRCAGEFNVPLFGVDIPAEEDEQRENLFFVEPYNTKSAEEYIESCIPNAPMEQRTRSDIVREKHMAYKIYHLSRLCKKILFVCGAFHWRNIKDLLQKDAISCSPEPNAERTITRNTYPVNLSKDISCQFSDALPVLTFKYEAFRTAKRYSSSQHGTGSLNAEKIIFSHLMEVFKNCKEYADSSKNAGSSISSEQFDKLLLFIDNYKHVTQKKIVSFAEILYFAETMIHARFARFIKKQMQNFHWYWPARCKYPFLDVPKNVGAGLSITVSLTGEKISGTFINSRTKGHSSSGTLNAVSNKDFGETTHKHSWAPWDNLVTAMTYKACANQFYITPQLKSVEFTSGLNKGIDFKKTIYSEIRGENKVFVKKTEIKHSRTAVLQNCFPIVWLFNPDLQDVDPQMMHHPLDWLKRYAVNPELFDMYLIQKLNSFYCCKGFSIQGESFKKRNISYSKLCGLAVYSPPLWSNRQISRWAVDTQFSKNPLIAYMKEGMDDYHKNDWASALILEALCYASGRLTIVAPSNYQVKKHVYEYAHRKNVCINHSDIANFPTTFINRIQQIHYVPVLASNPITLYPQWVSETLNEPQHKFSDLVPKMWLSY